MKNAGFSTNLLAAAAMFLGVTASSNSFAFGGPVTKDHQVLRISQTQSEAADYSRGKSSFGDPAKRLFVPLTISIGPDVVVGGADTTATITLNAPAPSGGVEITLKSSNNAVARFGGNFAAIGTSQLKIPEGNIRATFPVRTFGVASRTNVTLQALSLGDTASATVTVNPASIKTLTIAPSRLLGGSGASGTVTLDGLAPAGTGLAVKLAVVREASSRIGGDSLTSSTTPVSIPASVTVPSGGSSATFSITTVPVALNTAVAITAGAGREAVSNISDGTSNTISLGESTTSIGSATAAITVLAPVVSKLVLNPASVPGGSGSIGSVVLSGTAPSGGLSVKLSVSSGIVQGEDVAVAQSVSNNGATIPSSITVEPGADHQDFKITTLPTNTSNSVTISAAVAGANNLRQAGGVTTALGDGSVRTVGSGILPPTFLPPVTATLTITPTPPPFTISVQPTQVVGGATVQVTLTLNPTTTGSTSVGPITFSSNHPELLVLPATAPSASGSTLTAGAQTVVFNAFTIFAGTDQNVTITATGQNSSATAALQIKQTPPLASFTLRPTSVTGGSNIIAQFLLVNGATSPVTVNLSTDHPELITMPPTLILPVSPVATPFTFHTSTTTTPTTVRVTATAGPQTITLNVDIAPSP